MTQLTSSPQTSGYFWAVIQEWMDTQEFPPSGRRLADAFDVSSSALNNWKFGRHFPSVHNLKRIARVLGVSYERLLDGVLIDQGYKPPPPPEPTTPASVSRTRREAS